MGASAMRGGVRKYSPMHGFLVSFWNNVRLTENMSQMKDSMNVYETYSQHTIPNSHDSSPCVTNHLCHPFLTYFREGSNPKYTQDRL